jgi:hypothetical protein
MLQERTNVLNRITSAVRHRMPSWATAQIPSLLQETGFTNVEGMETREERNGPGVLLIARRQ